MDEDTGRSGYVYDRRIASHIYIDETGQRVVRVVTDADWYAWLDDPRGDGFEECPHGKPWPVELVWEE